MFDYTMNHEALGFMDELLDTIDTEIHEYLQHSAWSPMEQDIINKVITKALYTAHQEIEDGKAMEDVLREELSGNLKEPFDFDGIDI